MMEPAVITDVRVDDRAIKFVLSDGRELSAPTTWSEGGRGHFSEMRTRGEHRRWASLLVATVEALRERDGLPVPAGAREPGYRLSEPWYLYEGAGRMREWPRESTPAPFAERNVWSGDRLLRRT